MHEYVVVTLVLVAFALAEAIRGGLLNKRAEVSDDIKVEAVSTLVLFIFTQPGILLATYVLLHLALPAYEGAFAHVPVYLQVLCFLVFDDMTQYWWHRLSHSVPALYNLHRAHHNAGYMSVRIVYRNNLFYYLMMPSIWCSGALIYFGFGDVYAGYLIVKLSVIIGAHSEWKWDSALYKYRWLHISAWIIERTISTPSTHSAHHGLRSDDDVTHYKGNYGNLLFLWDVLFGTAKITRRYPKEYGVWGMRYSNWKEQLIWPIYTTPKDSQKEPE
ncbi:fatty acid hydroxylase family protein [Alteromonas sediminis]|uniref:Fatty acid hydroxylase family protein n=1 Tax=Alteromonas sediminis TaxID=2259342 RepID=A0A3N5Y8R4_9ALTE|nr:sterol desaturase family protein [Alteromonas sediminis]RPJ64855.1 fatty acid hydroxylase family protein [Alteromonas sediminis]